MSKFNFKSQICTSRVQSERLLALGLKKETADMVWIDHAMTEEYEDWKVTPVEEWDDWNEHYIPAWSLHRLIEMCPYYIEFGDKEWVLMVNQSDVQYKVTGGSSYVGSFIGADLYTNLIDCIEWLIKEGRVFPKRVFGLT